MMCAKIKYYVSALDAQTGLQNVTRNVANILTKVKGMFIGMQSWNSVV